mgnify:CR=1 FL=1
MQPLLKSVKDSILGVTGGLIPGPPVLLLALPALALVLGVAAISWWVKKTAAALAEKKRLEALKKQN